MNLCFVDDAGTIVDELMQAEDESTFREGVIGLGKIVRSLQNAQQKNESPENSPAAPVQQAKYNIKPCADDECSDYSNDFEYNCGHVLDCGGRV